MALGGRALLALALLSAAPSPARADDAWLSVAGQVGAFGLFNLDQTFTPAEATFGVTPAAEVALGEVVSVGGEVVLAWVKSEEGTRHHLIVSPHARVRLRFPVAEALDVELLLAAGLTVWPADDAEAALHPALTETRVGWSLRVGAGVGWRLDERWALLAHAGYLVSSTWTEALAATVDGFLLSLGPRLRF